MTLADPPLETCDTHPKLHLWLKDRGLGDTAAGELFGVTRQAVRLWRLPFADPRRQRPQSEDLLAVIYAKTAGEVTIADFYPPHLRPRRPGEARPGHPAVLAAGRSS